jgi:hypothetical protein
VTHLGAANMAALATAMATVSARLDSLVVTGKIGFVGSDCKIGFVGSDGKIGFVGSSFYYFAQKAFKLQISAMVMQKAGMQCTEAPASSRRIKYRNPVMVRGMFWNVTSFHSTLSNVSARLSGSRAVDPTNGGCVDREQVRPSYEATGPDLPSQPLLLETILAANDDAIYGRRRRLLGGGGQP